MTSRIPLRDRAGRTVAYSLVDDADFIWLSQWAWHKTSNGYAQRSEQRDGVSRKIKMHRQILGLGTGDHHGGVDHKDLDGLNNQRSNLRTTTKAQNMQNLGPRGGSSDHLGVSWHKRARKWRAYGKAAGKQVHLGLFLDEEAAARVASDWRAEHLPFSQEALLRDCKTDL